MFFRWEAIVWGAKFNIDAISLIAFPCFIRLTILISEEVKNKYVEDKVCENGEIMFFKFTAKMFK